MTDMAEAQIRDLLTMGEDERVEALKAMLPKPTYPEHLFGLWATHPELGEVMCGWDKPNRNGYVLVRWRDDSFLDGVNSQYVPVSELTFPYQATRPEDVPVGEAWLVNVDNGDDSGERVAAFKFDDNYWQTGVGVVDDEFWWFDEDVTLIAPLVPDAPDLPATPAADTPEFVETEEEYEELPEGSVVAFRHGEPLLKVINGFRRWGYLETAEELSGERRQVLRRGGNNG